MSGINGVATAPVNPSSLTAVADYPPKSAIVTEVELGGGGG